MRVAPVVVVGLFLVLCTNAALDIAKLCEDQTGFLICLNETHWLRCLETGQSLGTCDVDTVCLCGRMSAIWSTPCGYDFATLSDDCEGSAGDTLATETETIYSPHSGTTLGPTDHIPLALFLDNPAMWPTAVAFFISQENYDDPELFTPAEADKACSFHSRQHYLNPTQLFIGVPSETVTIGSADFDVRVPDKRTAMHLALALDHWGINPSWLLGIAAAASRLTLVPSSWNVTSTTVAYGDWWCNEKGTSEPQCTAYYPKAWSDGPFQQTDLALALDISAIPDTLGWTDLPVYASRHWFMRQVSSMSAYHDSMVAREAWRAFHTAAVHAHVLHTAVSLLPGLRWGDGSAEIEAVAVARMWDTALSDDKLGLAMDVCKLVDSASTVLDMPLYLEDVVDFVRLLHEGEAQAPLWRDEGVDWTTLLSQTTAAFAVLGSRRAALNPELDPQGRDMFVSLRYDWRLLLAIIRAHLPPREPIVGRSVAGLHKLYGPVSQASWLDMTENYPSLWCSTAGGFEQLCKWNGEPIDNHTSSAPDSTFEANSASMSQMACTLMAALVSLLLFFI